MLFAENRTGHLKEEFKPLYDHYYTMAYFDGLSDDGQLIGICMVHLFPQMSRFLLQGPLKPPFASYVRRLKQLIKWERYTLTVGLQYRYFVDWKERNATAQPHRFALKCADEIRRITRQLDMPSTRVAIWLASDNLRDFEKQWVSVSNKKWSVFHLASSQLQHLRLGNAYDFTHTARGPRKDLFSENLKPMLDFHMLGELDVLFSTGTTFAITAFLRTPLKSSTVGYRTYYQIQRGDQEETLTDPRLIFG
jgi:hypothetical protein